MWSQLTSGHIWPPFLIALAECERGPVRQIEVKDDEFEGVSENIDLPTSSARRCSSLKKAMSYHLFGRFPGNAAVSIQQFLNWPGRGEKDPATTILEIDVYS